MFEILSLFKCSEYAVFENILLTEFVWYDSGGSWVQDLCSSSYTALLSKLCKRSIQHPQLRWKMPAEFCHNYLKWNRRRFEDDYKKNLKGVGYLDFECIKLDHNMQHRLQPTLIWVLLNESIWRAFSLATGDFCSFSFVFLLLRNVKCIQCV